MPRQDISIWLHETYDDIAETNSGTELRIDCPACNDTKKHLYVSRVKRVFHCFKCGYAGSWTTLVRDVQGVSYPMALAMLAKGVAVTVGEFQSIADRLITEDLADESEVFEDTMPYWYKPLTYDDGSMGRKFILKYALSRLDPADIIRWGMGYVSLINSDSSRYALRLIMPIEDGFFQARTISSRSKGAKYIHSDESIAHRMFNGGALDHHDDITISEGVLSAIAAGDNAVGILGKNLNQSQLSRIAASEIKHVTIALDAGETVAAIAIAKELNRYGVATNIRDYSWGDPDSNREDYTTYRYTFKHQLMVTMGMA